MSYLSLLNGLILATVVVAGLCFWLTGTPWMRRRLERREGRARDMAITLLRSYRRACIGAMVLGVVCLVMFNVRSKTKVYAASVTCGEEMLIVEDVSRRCPNLGDRGPCLQQLLRTTKKADDQDLKRFKLGPYLDLDHRGLTREALCDKKMIESLVAKTIVLEKDGFGFLKAIESL